MHMLDLFHLYEKNQISYARKLKNPEARGQNPFLPPVTAFSNLLQP